MNLVLDQGLSDPQRVREFFDEFMKPTGHLPWHLEKRSQEIDDRIRVAGLTLADKIEVFKKLAPRPEYGRLGAVTGENKELRMERLLLSLGADELPLFKFVLEYDGDYKDMEEYLFHDIDDKERRARIIAHLRQSRPAIGLKVLTDVDDTLYANLIEKRYPKKTLYPGIVEFYDALKREPFNLGAVPITTLSARPNPVAGFLEEESLKSLVEFTNEKLRPSALSGALVSAAAGTVETWLRSEQEDIDLLCDKLPYGQENEIGEAKFANFARFSAVYPEYRYVFVGDSGQADALTAYKMLSDASTEGASRVVTTFIHDLRETDNDRSATSHAIDELCEKHADMLIDRASATGHGVIVFRNYIEAAVIAYKHSDTLENLITAESLAEITKAALKQFQEIDFQGKEAAGRRLWEQYRQDAKEVCNLLNEEVSLGEMVADIRHLLNTAMN